MAAAAGTGNCRAAGTFTGTGTGVSHDHGQGHGNGRGRVNGNGGVHCNGGARTARAGAEPQLLMVQTLTVPGHWSGTCTADARLQRVCRKGVPVIRGYMRGVVVLFAGVLAVSGCERDRAKTLETDHVRVWLQGLAQDSTIRFASGDTVQVSKATVDFYRSRRFQPAWVGEDGLLPRGRDVLNAIGRSTEDGLSNRIYKYEIIYNLSRNLEKAEEQSVADSVRAGYLAGLDVMLSEGFNRYANDLVRGTLDPEKAGVAWRIPRGGAREDIVLNAIIEGQPASQVVNTLRPSMPQYERMRKVLAEYQQIAARGGWPKVPQATLKQGERDSAVAVLRTRLVSGLDANEAALAQKGAADPALFDAELKKALRHFQDRHGIEADGALGEKTLEELNRSVQERIDELRLNMDRWRWLPDDFGERYILVNIAGFELEFIDQNQVVEAMSVVVGQPAWETPVMIDTMESIVVNPYWNVPKSIYDEEIAVALAQDPGYLERNNMERTKDGSVRQRPGPDNALGRFKFLFPNDDDIYLHDTPADHLFSRTRRDFSHGCIRLERPEDLARLLVRMQTNKSPAILDEMLASKSERWISLDRKLPVYLLYFTAWVDQDGTTHFHHDIYGRDQRLEPQKKAMDGVRVAATS